MNTQIPDPDEFEWEFEQNESVGVWYMKGWKGFADEDLEAATQHYRQKGSNPEIKATIAVFGSETNLAKETQEYMGKEWSENGEYTGVDKIGFVSEGIVAMAVESQMDIDSAEVKKFSELENALEWAKE